jgi:hypothetical protein
MMEKILLWLQEHIKRWTKLATSVLIIGIISDLTRSHTDRVESTSQTTATNQP